MHRFDAQKLKRAIDDSPYSVTKVAAEVGVSFSGLYKLLSGENSNPTGSTLLGLSRVLGMPVEYFYTEVADNA